MNRIATTIKKHLNFDALRISMSKHLHSIKDNREKVRCDYDLHDAIMSGFACMFYQEPSLAEFQRRLEIEENRNNLCTLFGVQKIPKNSQLKDIIDDVDSEHFRPIFNDIFKRLQRGKQLEQYQILPDKYICAIDGVYHHSSENIHCNQCLKKQHRNGTITYSHGVLQGAIVHPDRSQVIPVMPEAIANTDGSKKQDCEINAAKRFITKLKKDHPQLGIIITADGLFSKSPMVRLVQAESMNFLFVAKPDDHVYMMEWIKEFDCLPEVVSTDNKGRMHTYRYKNNVPLNGQADAPKVNYIYYEIADSEGVIKYKNSWVTDITINGANVINLARGGRSRWKIENECFNTLKNQGYELKHNFGHGQSNLSHNMYLLTMLAYLFHQVFEMSDPDFIACRKKFVAKRSMWGHFRVLVDIFVFESWQAFMDKALRRNASPDKISKI